MSRTLNVSTYSSARSTCAWKGSSFVADARHFHTSLEASQRQMDDAEDSTTAPALGTATQQQAQGAQHLSSKTPTPSGEVWIDRSKLSKPQEVRRSDVGARETELMRHLIARIMFGGGPLTMAEFMSAALTHPTGGFYMRSDVFGSKGHFVTSPEISQLFGEMVGVWSVCLWDQMGRPPEIVLVEMGPGRGTLMKDLLRAMGKVRGFASAVRLHLVEVSPTLQRLQYEALQCVPREGPGHAPGDGAGGGGHSARSSDVNGGQPAAPASASSQAGVQSSTEGKDEASPGNGNGAPRVPDVAMCQLAGISIPVEWHRSLDTVPQGPAIIVAHEFFDALPVHQFQKTERGWCERLVDLAPAPAEGETTEGASPLRVVLSNRPTPAVQTFVPFRLQAAARAHAASLGNKGAPPSAGDPRMGMASPPGESGGHPAATTSTPRPGNGNEVEQTRRDCSSVEALAWERPRSEAYPEGIPQSRTGGGAPGSTTTSSSSTSSEAAAASAAAVAPPHESCTRMEVCPKGIALVQEIAARVGRHGGGALIIDYGSDDIVGDSLQAIRDQQFVDLLHEPGAADLSAYVDYGALRAAVEMSGEHAVVYGPVPQGPLLLGLGLQARLEQLLEVVSDKQGIDLIKGCERLVLDMKKGDELPDGSIAEFDGMGARYQAIAIVNSKMPTPIGFGVMQQDG